MGQKGTRVAIPKIWPDDTVVVIFSSWFCIYRSSLGFIVFSFRTVGKKVIASPNGTHGFRYSTDLKHWVVMGPVMGCQVLRHKTPGKMHSNHNDCWFLVTGTWLDYFFQINSEESFQLTHIFQEGWNHQDWVWPAMSHKSLEQRTVDERLKDKEMSETSFVGRFDGYYRWCPLQF